jgi:hypothetical protein
METAKMATLKGGGSVLAFDQGLHLGRHTRVYFFSDPTPSHKPLVTFSNRIRLWRATFCTERGKDNQMEPHFSPAHATYDIR